jgi:integrase
MADTAGLGRWHVHEARHTAASTMLAMGTKLEIVSRVLGHSSVTVTADVYAHLFGEAERSRTHDRGARTPDPALLTVSKQAGFHTARSAR